MTSLIIRSPPIPQRLGFRLAFALAVSLLPLGIISGLQSASLLEEARARSEAALLGETLLAVAPSAGLIRGAREAAAALAASMPPVSQDDAACSAVMRRVRESSAGTYSFVAFVPLSAIAVCNSSDIALDLRESTRPDRMRAERSAEVVVIRSAVASGASVLAFGHPVFDDAGTYIGYVSVSMPLDALQAGGSADAGNPQGQLEPIELITFDASGEILSASTRFEDAAGRLPRDRPLAELAIDGARSFVAIAINGDQRIYAVFPMVDDTVFALGSWPIAIATGPISFWVSPYLMPMLMWLASLLVAMLATERLVTRYIRRLRASITAFAGGNRRTNGLDMTDAASEIRDVADAYLKMTDTILHDSAELEDMVYQREVLLREVHHRVKNNLQLIASIINLQMRQSHSAEAKTLMKGLQDRVMSLATIHRGLYQTSGLANVRADELLSDILRQVLQMATGPGRRFHVITHFDELQLTPDQAVPLALWLTEALTNAMKYAGGGEGGVPRLDVSLRREGAVEAVMIVRNSIGHPLAEPDAEGGLGSRLLAAFGQQLAAKAETTATADSFAISLHFVLRSLADAEAATGPDPGSEAAVEPETSTST